jgi:hypothetical protein
MDQSVDQVEYVGVTITKEDLKWDVHWYNQHCQQSQQDYWLPEAEPQNHQSQRRSVVYKPMVRPLLEYASPVWDPVSIRITNNMEKVQRRAARWVKQDYRQATKSEDLVKYTEVKTYRRFLDNLLC